MTYNKKGNRPKGRRSNNNKISQGKKIIGRLSTKKAPVYDRITNRTLKAPAEENNFIEDHRYSSKWK